mgnify:FL=1
MIQIELQHLSKTYRILERTEGTLPRLRSLFHPAYTEKQAVRDLSFSIDQGECVAFLGANGAGKSTTIKMLTGIMAPTGGSVRVCGKDPFRNRLENAAQIGVVFGQKTQLWWDIPVIETFRLLKSIYQIPTETYNRNLTHFRELLELDAFLDQPARKLSLGQRVRADLAASLLHEPPILFLDEPTIGLDVAVKQKIYYFLRELHQRQHTTILLTSHDMNDLESLCERLIILEQGQLLFDDAIDRIFDAYPEGTTLEEIVIGLFNRRSHV